MIGSMIGRIATAEKMSVDQLREALENKTLPAYIAIPLLQEKMDMEQRMRAAVTGRSQMPEQPPLADEVMLRAQNERGITSLPSHMVPNMAGGGIVAFAGGGETERERRKREIQERNARAGAWWDRVLPDMDRTILDTREIPANLGPAGVMRRSLDPHAGDMPPVEREAAVSPPPEQGPPMRIDMAGTTPETPGTAATDGVPGRTPPNQGIAAIPTKPSGTRPTAQPATQPAAPQEAKPSAMQKYVDLLMQDRESAKGERNDAKWMALLQAGLATMSGTSPYALQNIGQGASVGLQAYNAAVSDMSKREREALEKALAAEAAIEDMGLKREQFESEKEYRAGMLDLKKEELGIMAAKAAAAAAGAGTGIKPKDRATLVINLTKTYMEQGMPQAEAASAAQAEVDYLLGITPQHTDSGKPDPRLAGGARMFKYPTQ